MRHGAQRGQIYLLIIIFVFWKIIVNIQCCMYTYYNLAICIVHVNNTQNSDDYRI